MFDCKFYQSVLGFTEFMNQMKQNPSRILPSRDQACNVESSIMHLKELEDKYHIKFDDFYFNYYMKKYFKYFNKEYLPKSK